MGYKQEIDKQRQYKAMIEFNLEQIKNDIIYFDNKDKELVLEYLEYKNIIIKINNIIDRLQPWYRQWTKFYY